MHGRIADLTPANLDDLPSTCRRCVFWESPRGARGPTAASSAVPAKEAWFQATQLEWGAPGKVVRHEGQAIGYALFAPGPYFPRARALKATVSDDAFLLATLWVDPDHRGGGIASSLLQAVLKETHHRGRKALEAFGTAAPAPWGCVLATGFLERAGFELRQPDPLMPLYRLDLRRTARWQEAVEQALEGVAAVLGRRDRQPAPRPALESGRA